MGVSEKGVNGRVKMDMKGEKVFEGVCEDVCVCVCVFI